MLINVLYFRQHNVIPILSDILSDTVKEKVSRIILATFKVSRDNVSFFLSTSTVATLKADTCRP